MRLLVLLAYFILAVPAAADPGSAAYRLLRLDGMHLKWGPPEFGAGAEVSYGFATTREEFPDAINCRGIAPMAVMATVWRHDPARLERIAREAFTMWSSAANVTFRRAARGERPQILIGAQADPRRVAFADVWPETGAARGGVAPLRRAAICLNPQTAWSIEGRVRAGRLDLRTVLAHEIGHTLGLDHPGADGALMGYADQGPQRGLMRGDIAGARRLYGTRTAEAR